MTIYRSQEIQDRCTACKEVATGRCRKCQVWFCAAHAGPSFKCCSSCSAELELALTRAGYGQRGLGSALTFLSAGFLYITAAYHLITPLIAAALIASGASGLGLLGWSFGVSPRRMRRKLETQLAERKALASGDREPE